MNLLSAASIVSCIVYLYIGFYAFSTEKRSKMNQLFLAFCIGMSIWSFAYAFVYVSGESQHIWMKISAIGWCTFSSFILHIVLIFIESKLIEKVLIKILLYFPSALFFYISVFLFKKGAPPSQFVQNFFYTGDFIYHFSFLITSILLILIWSYKSHDIRIRKQGKIIVLSSITPFLFNLLTQTILPIFGISFPLMGHIYSLIMVLGVYYAMIKYRFMTINPKQLIKEILHEMMDLVILISPEGKIIKVNTSTCNLLGYSSAELLNKPLSTLIQYDAFDEIVNNSKGTEMYMLKNKNCVCKNGLTIPVNLTCSSIIDPLIRDMLGILIVGQDITLVKKLEREVENHKKAEEYINYIANHDSLTGLPNRKYFYQTLEQSLNRGRNGNERFAVLFLDLDGLKIVNDNYGHEAGDQLLWEVGNRSKKAIKDGDFAARIGGDEFTFIIFNINEIADARGAAEEIIRHVNTPICINGKTFNVSASIGVSLYPEDGTDMSNLIKKADDEMYMIKKRKKAGVL